MTKIVLYGELDDIFTKKILIILEELKMEYTFENIKLFSHEENGFTLLYKGGPIVVYDEKILCEPKFIMRYLAKNNNDDIDLYGSSSSDMWLNFECDIMKCLDIYEKQLENCEFLSGDTYTIADIYYIPESYMLLKNGNKQEIKKRENVYNWLKKIIRRESVKNVLNKNLVYNKKKDKLETLENIKKENYEKRINNEENLENELLNLKQKDKEENLENELLNLKQKDKEEKHNKKREQKDKEEKNKDNTKREEKQKEKNKDNTKREEKQKDKEEKNKDIRRKS